MRSVGFSDVIEMWTNISKKYKEPYGKRLNVRFDARHKKVTSENTNPEKQYISNQIY